MQYKCTTRQAVRPVGYGPSLREAQLLPPGPRGTRPWHPARPLPCHPVALRSGPAAALTWSRPATASAPRARPHEPRPCSPVGGGTPPEFRNPNNNAIIVSILPRGAEFGMGGGPSNSARRRILQ